MLKVYENDVGLFVRDLEKNLQLHKKDEEVWRRHSNYFVPIFCLNYALVLNIL